MPFLYETPLGYASDVIAARIWKDTRDPASSDFKNFSLGDIWINPSAHRAWILTDRSASSGDWIQMAATGNGILTITTEDATAVGADGDENIFVVGSDHITTTGDAGTHTVTINLDDTIADRFDTASGSAIPASGIVEVVGAGGLAASGAANVLTITANGAFARSFPTNSGTATPSLQTLNINGGTGIGTTGVGNTVAVNLTSPVVVANGGTGRTSSTAYAVICGGTTSTNPQQSIASVGTSTQVLTSKGAGMLPVMANPSMQFLAHQTASNSASIEFLNLDNANGAYLFMVDNMRPGTNNVNFMLNLSDDGGMTWAAASFESSLLYNAFNSTTNLVSSSTAGIVLGAGIQGGGVSSTGSYILYFNEIGNATSTAMGNCCYFGNGTVMQHGRMGATTPISAPSTNFNSFQFIMSSGNIALGDFSVYKINRTSPV